MPPTMTRVPLTLCTPSAKCPSGADKRSLLGRNSCSGLEKTATPAFACSFLVYSVGVNPYFNLHLQIWEGGALVSERITKSVWGETKARTAPSFGQPPRLDSVLIPPTFCAIIWMGGVRVLLAVGEPGVFPAFFC